VGLTLSSPSFADGDKIPRQHGCEGANASPALSWSGAPPATRSFALVVDDPDAPDPAAPKKTWVHWVLYDLPAETAGLPEGVKSWALPAGTFEGRNDWKKKGYGGPCPPIGRHRYFFKLYALDTVLPDLGAATKQELEAAMKGRVVAETQLVGTYQKGDP
jgi:Raf kinase inhibitor-like YbhB/YbcL family protein